MNQIQTLTNAESKIGLSAYVAVVLVLLMTCCISLSGSSSVNLGYLHDGSGLGGGGDDTQGVGDYGLCGNLNGSTYYNGSCLIVFPELMSWVDATNFCQRQANGLQLAEPASHLFLDVIYSLMVSATIDASEYGNMPVDGGGGWLGARRDVPGMPYRWSSSDKSVWTVTEDFASRDWPHETADENCLAVDTSGKMSGVECNRLLMPVCQLSIDPVCEAGTRYYDGYCYYFENSMKRYQNSKDLCQLENDELVEIHTEGAVLFLQEFLLEHMWRTISFISGAAFMELDEYGVQKKPGKEFCFLVKGIGMSKMIFYKPLVQPSSCSFELYLDMERTPTESNIDLNICDTCSQACSDEDSPIGIYTDNPGYTPSHYCLTNDNSMWAVELKHRSLWDDPNTPSDTEFLIYAYPGFNVDDLTAVKIAGPAMAFQWTFPVNQGRSSVYLGAETSKHQWQSGVDIDYQLLYSNSTMSQLSVNPADQNRLLFQPYPLSYRPSDGSDQVPVLCRHSWGNNIFFGVIPLGHLDSSWLRVSHVTSSIALVNYQPHLMNVLGHTLVKMISLSDDGDISLKQLFADDDDEKDRLFIVRSIDQITVELFSKSDTHVYSTLVFPDVITHTEYVISAPEAELGRVFILNQWQVNTVSIQIPKLRQVFIHQGSNTYRAYLITIGDLTPLQMATFDFTGDISGAAITGTSKMSVFVGTSMVDNDDDISLDQTLPASKTAGEYVTLRLTGTALESKTTYRVVALMGDTYVHFSNGHNVTLSSHGDNDVTFHTSSEPQRMTSKQPFYASVEFSDSKMICSTTLLPSMYWTDNYVISLTSRHLIGDLALYLVIEMDGSPAFIFNGARMPLACSSVFGTPYQSCYYLLKIGHYTIKSNTAGQNFAAYIYGAHPGSKCFSRPAGIRFSDTTDNGYRTPPFEEPNECPDSVPPTTQEALPTGSMTTELMASDLLTSESPTTNTPTTDTPTTDTPTTDTPTTDTPTTDTPTTDTPTTDTITTYRRPFTHPYANVTLTQEVIQEIQEKVRLALQVDAHTVSKFVRKKISAPDSRTSSSCMGYVGVAMITMVTVLMIVPDVMSLSSWVIKKCSVKVDVW